MRNLLTFGLWSVVVILATLGSVVYLYQERFSIFGEIPVAKVENCPSIFSNDAAACYARFTKVSIVAISNDLSWWTRYLNLCVFGGVLFGVISTVVIALQGEARNQLLKTVGIIATVLATSLNTVMTTFHVHDNIDKLIEVRSKLMSLANNLQHDLRYQPDLDKKNEIIFEFVKGHQALIDDAYRIKGSAGRLHTKPNPNP